MLQKETYIDSMFAQEFPKSVGLSSFRFRLLLPYVCLSSFYFFL